MQTTAVLLHLANLRHWSEFQSALEKINCSFDLFVNLLQGVNSKHELSRQRQLILNHYPNATIIDSPNRGMDVGGMFQLFALVAPLNYGALLYAHSKSDDSWRKAMLEILSGVDAALLEKMRQPDSELGMIGTYAYPFDYFNIRPFLQIAESLEINITTSWESLIKRLPSIAELSIEQRIAWAKKHKNNNIRPEIDLEYAAMVLGEQSQNTDHQSMQQGLLKRFIADGVLGPLAYFPGNCFWVSGHVISLLSEKVDFSQEFEKLTADLASDTSQQSRAHAWERILPVFASKNGLQILPLARQK
ncbi:MAG: hypothetical protein ACI9FR_002319 [Cryomorphaceae bacterium]|jgi:hypothetical protein